MNLELVKEWLPPVIYRPLLSLASEIKFMAYPHKDILQKNLQLKGIGKGKRAFLLATGPSINQENLRLLAGEDCFSISNFYHHDDIQVINPLFHGFAPYHEPMDLGNYVEWLKQADRILPERTKIVLGHKAYDMVQKFRLFPEREIFYLYLSMQRGTDLMRPVLCPQTGPILLLPLLIYMGYKQIYLLGCDSTTLRDYKKTITNFYCRDKDMRINATSYWIDVETELKGNLVSFDQYNFYNDVASTKSISITNLSVDSWLEMFPFDRLDRIIHLKNQENCPCN